MDNNVAAPQKIKQRKTVRSNDSTSGCEPERMEGRVLERELYTDAHAQQPTNMSTEGRTEKHTRSACIVEC